MKEFKKKTLQLPCPTPKLGYTWVVSTVLSTVLPTAQELGWGRRTQPQMAKELSSGLTTTGLRAPSPQAPSWDCAGHQSRVESGALARRHG